MLSDNIKFTKEIESKTEGLICLDLRLRLVDSLEKYPGRLELHFEHYRKSTASDQVLHYHSAHDPKTKSNYISSSVLSILKNSSDFDTAMPAIESLKQRLLKGAWPLEQIEKFRLLGIRRFEGLCNSEGIFEHRCKQT